MHIMSMLWSITDAVSSNNCPILFKFLMLNIAICIVHLYFSNLSRKQSFIKMTEDKIRNKKLSVGFLKPNMQIRYSY